MVTLASIQFLRRPHVDRRASRDKQYRNIWEVYSDAAISAPRLCLHIYSPYVTLLCGQMLLSTAV